MVILLKINDLKSCKLILMELDMKTIAHVGGELLVVGGLVIWVNKNVGELKTKVQTLEETVEVQKKHINDMTEHVKKLTEMVFRQQQAMESIIGGSPLPPPVPPRPKIEDDNTEEEPVNINPKDKTKDRIPKPKEKQRREMRPEDLDRIIKEELEKELSSMKGNEEIVIDTRLQEPKKTLKHKKKDK